MAASELPRVRDTTALEVYNVPLFEIPPMLDVRSSAAFRRSHVMCAVSVPLEDGPDAQRLFQRILDHDEDMGWALQHPVVVVHDEDSRERADWLVGVLRGAIQERAGVEGFEGADNAERLLRRLAFQCRQILLLRHSEFASAFGSCCAEGSEWTATAFFDRFGPLPRCALLQPRIFVAGRQVQMTPELLELLGISHAVVNADFWDAMDGTSGGGSTQPFSDRQVDAEGVRYLKCTVSEQGGDPDAPRVLDGAARFLAEGAARGGTGLVRLYGQSCSVAVVCSFLIASQGLSVEAAWQVLQAARMQVDERLVWWEALRRLRPWAGSAIEDGAPEPAR